MVAGRVDISRRSSSNSCWINITPIVFIITWLSFVSGQSSSLPPLTPFPSTTTTPLPAIISTAKAPVGNAATGGGGGEAKSQQCLGLGFPKRIRECCNFPNMASKELMDKCRPKFNPNNAPKAGQPIRGCCYVECLFLGTNNASLLVNNTINRLEFEKWVNRTILSSSDGTNKTETPEFQRIVVDAVETCFKEATARKDEFTAGFALPPLNPDDPVCHPISSFVITCTQMQIFKNCPADKVYGTNDKECGKFKEYVQKCPFGPK